MKKEKQLKIAAWISGGVTILLIAYMISWKWIIPKYFLNALKNSEAQSIGIIGGADGPTAIYITTKLAHENLAMILIVCFAILTFIFTFLIKSAKKK